MILGEFSKESARLLFPKRPLDSHKGMFGRSVIIGGSLEYSGAAKLASLASSALRSGCGLCTLAVPKEIAGAMLPYILENTLVAMPSQSGHLIFSESEFEDLIRGATSIAFGMGIGLHEGNVEILDYLLHNFRGRLLFDADALNLLAKNMQLLQGKTSEVVITPHLMEFSRLTGYSLDKIKGSPAELAYEFATKNSCTVLLKGHVTYISGGEKTFTVSRGSAGMAKGGSGDVLSGIICGLNAFSKEDCITTAATGALIAAIAGESAAKKYGEYSMLASDEIKEIAFAIQSILN